MARLHTHYDNLKVARDAPPEIIRAAYRTLTQKFHPDKHPGDHTAARIMQIINGSYSVLIDPAARQAHDAWIASMESSEARQESWTTKAHNPSPKAKSSLSRYLQPFIPLIFIILLPLGIIAFSEIGTSNSRSGSSDYGCASDAACQPGWHCLKDGAPVGVCRQTDVGSRGSLSSTQQKAAIAPSEQEGYVAAALANIRNEASAKASIIAKLPRWTRVTMGDTRDVWTHVSFVIDGAQGEGYVLTKLIQTGRARDARVAYCESANPIRPNSGTVLRQLSTGTHSIKVKAGAADVLVKLRQKGKTELAFFVRANETGLVPNVSDGTYKFMFASGGHFSQKCLEFMDDMQVLADPTPAIFHEWKEPTEDGFLVHYMSAEYELEFQREGNFRPVSVDLKEFEE